MTTFDIKKFEQKNISKDAILKVENVMWTTYEDGSIWIEYRVNNRLGYEISYEYTEDDVEKIKEDIKNGFLKIDDKKTVSVDEMINKPYLETCSKDLADLAEKCRQSENEMWFVDDEDDLEYYGYSLENLEDEVSNLDIDNYVTFYDDGCLITVYGGIIKKFLF